MEDKIKTKTLFGKEVKSFYRQYDKGYIIIVDMFPYKYECDNQAFTAQHELIKYLNHQ